MERPEDYDPILKALHPSQCWYGYSDSDNRVYENIIIHPEVWDSGQDKMVSNPHEKPTKEFLDSELARLQAEYDSQEYARNRATAYPPIGDQLDALFHAGVFPADMAAQLQAVKDKYPND